MLMVCNTVLYLFYFFGINIFNQMILYIRIWSRICIHIYFLSKEPYLHPRLCRCFCYVM